MCWPSSALLRQTAVVEGTSDAHRALRNTRTHRNSLFTASFGDVADLSLGVVVVGNEVVDNCGQCDGCARQRSPQEGPVQKVDDTVRGGGVQRLAIQRQAAWRPSRRVRRRHSAPIAVMAKVEVQIRSCFCCGLSLATVFVALYTLVSGCLRAVLVQSGWEHHAFPASVLSCCLGSVPWCVVGFGMAVTVFSSSCQQR